MGKNSQHFLKSIDRQLNYYLSEYFLERFWLDLRIQINDYFFPLPPMKDREDTKKYVARISPDQAVRYSSHLVEIWRGNAKLVDSVDISAVPKRSWRKMEKRRREILEGARIAEEVYAESLERKRQEDNS